MPLPEWCAGTRQGGVRGDGACGRAHRMSRLPHRLQPSRRELLPGASQRDGLTCGTHVDAPCGLLLCGSARTPCGAHVADESPCLDTAVVAVSPRVIENHSCIAVVAIPPRPNLLRHRFFFAILLL